MKQLYSKVLLFILSGISINATGTPLLFIENKGQVTDQYRNVRMDIDLSVPNSGMTLFISSGQLHYQFSKTELNKDNSTLTKMYRLDVELMGADKHALLIKEEPQYFTERYYTDLFDKDGGIAHSYTRAIYKNIYPGIDWVLYIKDNELKHEFVVSKGADASLIKLKYSGATAMKLKDDGSLLVTTPMGNIAEAKPYSYDDKAHIVASSFELNGDELSFRLARYEGTLTIDPAVGWSTYYGNGNNDYGTGIAHDLAGNFYMVGYTASTNMATTGSHQFSLGGGWTDGLMVKFNSMGQRIWATYYGGSESDVLNCVTVSNGNHVYVAGSTASTNAVATPGTHKPTTNVGNGEAFLAKFDTSGQRLWGTYYGGPSSESIVRIACDNSGAIYATGSTNSVSEISTNGTHQAVFAGGFNDAFLAKFTPSGTLTWGTYMGGAQGESAKGLCIDNLGDIYISGETLSDTGISTPGSHQEVMGLNAGDLYLVKFNSAGGRIWGTYYGGNESIGETGGYCAYNGDGSVYLVGSTRSNENIATLDGVQPAKSFSFEVEAFAVKFTLAGSRIWGTYYGTLGTETVSAIACDNDGNLFMGGSGFSLYLGGPCSPQVDNAGNTDAFIIKLTNDCDAVWATYLGGTQQDYLNDLDYDGNGNLYATGYTMSPAGFGSPNVYQPTYSGGVADAFLNKYVDCANPGQTLGITGPTPVCEGDTVVYYVGDVCGATAYTWSLPQGWGGFSTGDSIVALVGQSGTISAYANVGCGSSSAQSLNITVLPAPEPPIFQNGTQLSTLIVYTSYQWGFNGTDIPGATLPYTTMFGGTGFYTLTVTDTNGCTGFSNYLPVSVKNEMLLNVKIFPNPAGNTVYIEGLKEAINYEIRNVVGMKLQEGVLKDLHSNIDITTLPKGIYLLKIGESSIKLVKE